MSRNETAIMKLMHNEFIIKYHDTYYSKSNIYIVAEVVNDGDLVEYILKRKQLKEPQAAGIMAMLFRCVEYMHSVGVIHRDLKPENIMLVLDKTKTQVVSLKLIDFGLAKQIDAHAKCSEGCGTPGYMGKPFNPRKAILFYEGAAPEVIKGELYDKTVDIFSLGVIMYMLYSHFSLSYFCLAWWGSILFTTRAWTSFSGEQSEMKLTWTQRQWFMFPKRQKTF
jgi:serine/threonine protein kinase